MLSLSLKLSSSHFILPHFHPNRNIRYWSLIKAKKSESCENLRNGEFNLQFRVSRAFIYRSAITVFGLGFIDAGYSGDWSRIGVISKEAEELLKNAAYLVVPICFMLIFFISDENKPL